MVGWLDKLTRQRLAQIDSSDLPNLPKASLGQGRFENALGIAFAFAGGIALVVLAYASLRYVLSRGNAEETTKARNTIIDALIGLAIIIGSFGIISFIMGFI